MAEQYCDKWAARLRAKFGDDVFAEGETSLAQATLDAMLEKRKLLVAVDETTGRLLGTLCSRCPTARPSLTLALRATPTRRRRAASQFPEQLLKRFPGDVVQAAAGRALAALQVTGADHAAAYMPASVGQCPFVLMCDRRGAVACALPPDMNDVFIGNQILDLLRRRLFGLQLTDSCITFRPGMTGRCWLCRRRAGAAATRCGSRCAAARPPRGTPTTRRILSRCSTLTPRSRWHRPPHRMRQSPGTARCAATRPPPRRRPPRRKSPSRPGLSALRVRWTPPRQKPAAPDPLDIQTAGPEAAHHARIRRARPMTAQPAEMRCSPRPGRTPPRHARCWMTIFRIFFLQTLTPPPLRQHRRRTMPPRPQGTAPAWRTFTRAATQLFDTSAVEEATREKAKKKSS